MLIKKTILIASLGLLHFTCLKAQNIPNASFENWTTTSGIQFLDNWIITAGQPSDTISPSPSFISFDSIYSLQLKTKYVFGAGLSPSLASIRYPINQNPKYFNGYYKSLRTGTGSAVIKVNMYNNNIKIGVGLLNIFDTSGNFKPFEMLINYSQSLIADEAEIVFLSDDITNGTLNNTLWVDKISFSDFPLSIKDDLNYFEEVLVYPIPVKDILNLDIKTYVSADLRILNIFGQVLLKSQLHSGINKINTEGFEEGIYFMETSIKGRRTVLKFVKQ